MNQNIAGLLVKNWCTLYIKLVGMMIYISQWTKKVKKNFMNQNIAGLQLKNCMYSIYQAGRYDDLYCLNEQKN
jgi:hypothetical protein